MKRNITILSIIITLVSVSMCFGNRGMMPINPNIKIFEPTQRAMIAWNGSKEILLLSTDISASDSTMLLEVLPLPAEPEVKKGDLETFQKATELINSKLRAAAIAAIPLFPSLVGQYGEMGLGAAGAKWAFVRRNLLWTASWLAGWEFLHRYVLVRKVHERWPRYGWLLVPLVEVVYHLQKPFVEAVGMGVFSILATQWTLRRRNVLLPFLAHLAIELGLLCFQVFS